MKLYRKIAMELKQIPDLESPAIATMGILISRTRNHIGANKMKTKSMYVTIALLLGFAMGSLTTVENGMYALPILLAMLVYSLLSAHRTESENKRFKARVSKYLCH